MASTNGGSLQPESDIEGKLLHEIFREQVSFGCFRISAPTTLHGPTSFDNVT